MELELDKLVGSVRKGIQVLAIQASGNMDLRRFEGEEADPAEMMR